MTESVQGNANAPQLATRGNYRAVDFKETCEISSRNVAHLQLDVSNLPQPAFSRNKKR